MNIQTKKAKDVFRMYYEAMAEEFYANDYHKIGNLLEVRGEPSKEAYLSIELTIRDVVYKLIAS